MGYDVTEWMRLNKEEGRNFAEIGRMFGVTRDTVKNAVHRYKAPPRVPYSLVEFPDLKEKPAQGWSGDYLSDIISAQKRMDDLDITQSKVPVNINEDLPYGVVFTGDWHIGGRGTDHGLLKEYFDLWRRAPGIGLVGMGDYSEMFVGKMARIGVVEHVMPPDMQIAAVCDQIESELKDVMLVILKGNHDAWAGSHMSNYVAQLAQRIHPTGKEKPGIPYLGLGGEILLTVGSVPYRLACWHRYPGQGAINRGNNQRRASNDHRGPDVTALAHLHYLFVEMSKYGETDEVRLRSGALKVTDEHSRDAAGNVVADVRMPMVVFDPRVNKKFFFPDFRDGIEPLLFWRKRWHRYPTWTADSQYLTQLLA